MANSKDDSANTTKKTTAKKNTKQTTSTTRKTATKSTPKKAAKEFKPDTYITCKSVRQNDLYYVSKSGIEYLWHGFGDIQDVLYGDIISMKACHSAFLYEPWLLILDKDLLEKPEFKRDFEDMYRIYEKFEDPKAFFSRDFDEIESELDNAPNGLRDLIIYNAAKYIEDGTLDRIAVVNLLDRKFGTNLKMLI